MKPEDYRPEATGRVPDAVRVYVNGHGVDTALGGSALDAVRAWDPAAAAAIGDGTRALADSRGLPLQPDTPAYGGMIIRVIAKRTPREPGDT